MQTRIHLVLLMFFITILSGCVSPPKDIPCIEGLTTNEYLTDPDDATVANINLADLDGDGVDEIFATRPLDGFLLVGYVMKMVVLKRFLRKI